MGGGTAVRRRIITLIFFAIGGFMINLVGPLDDVGAGRDYAQVCAPTCHAVGFRDAS